MIRPWPVPVERPPGAGKPADSTRTVVFSTMMR